MLGMVHAASADALIACFEAKYSFLAWRPLHAIRRADTDGNPYTIADGTWTSLLNVNHPVYLVGPRLLDRARNGRRSRRWRRAA